LADDECDDDDYGDEEEYGF
jgi:hypothetical protein